MSVESPTEAHDDHWSDQKRLQAFREVATADQQRFAELAGQHHMCYSRDDPSKVEALRLMVAIALYGTSSCASGVLAETLNIQRTKSTTQLGKSSSAGAIHSNQVSPAAEVDESNVKDDVSMSGSTNTEEEEKQWEQIENEELSVASCCNSPESPFCYDHSYTDKQKEHVQSIVDALLHHSPHHTSIHVGRILLKLRLKHKSGTARHVTTYVFRVPVPPPDTDSVKCKANDKNCSLTSESLPANDFQEYHHGFIDSHARFYHTWDNFLHHNDLPECYIVYPKDGVYEREDGTCQIEGDFSRACGFKQKLLMATDIASAVIGLTATGATIAAAMTPVGAVVVSASLIGGLTAGSYTAIRSACSLADRGAHGQSMSLTDKKSRHLWFNAAMGLASTGASGMAAAAQMRAAALVGKHTGLASWMLHRMASEGAHLAEGLADVVELVKLVEEVGPVAWECCEEDRLPTWEESWRMAVALFFFYNHVVHPITAEKLMRIVMKENAINGVNNVTDIIDGNDTNSQIVDEVEEAKNLSITKGICLVSLVDQYLRKHMSRIESQIEENVTEIRKVRPVHVLAHNSVLMNVIEKEFCAHFGSEE
ncbi:hypothetical protein DdX_02116 [Ditylenchus destructor]|uniref:DUF4781 domain-containing protein n=1 Tax=Ditylenchus destructor TaxID=166010 RepID=A0AAD4NEA6_9BILA|nr:hypothetical protein DdX_02116 [Ditylenchus destructor]